MKKKIKVHKNNIAITERMSFMGRGGLAIVAMRQLPRGFFHLPYKMSQKEAFEEF
jgi:hypothetical protein